MSQDQDQDQYCHFCGKKDAPRRFIEYTCQECSRKLQEILSKWLSERAHGAVAEVQKIKEEMEANACKHWQYVLELKAKHAEAIEQCRTGTEVYRRETERIFEANKELSKKNEEEARKYQAIIKKQEKIVYSQALALGVLAKEAAGAE